MSRWAHSVASSWSHARPDRFLQVAVVATQFHLDGMEEEGTRLAILQRVSATLVLRRRVEALPSPRGGR